MLGNEDENNMLEAKLSLHARVPTLEESMLEAESSLRGAKRRGNLPFCRRPLLNARGMTLIEIIIALMIMSIGMVSILALFSKGIQSTGEITNKIAGAMAARSAMAILQYQVESNLSHQPVWSSGSSWPDSSSDTMTTSVSANPSGSTLSVSSLGWDPDGYYAMMTSGREQGRVFLLSGTSSSATSLYIGVDAAEHDIADGDTVEIVGPNRIGPSSDTVLTKSDNPPLKLYTWMAIVCGEHSDVIGLHRTFIFVYGRDASEDIVATPGNINDYKPVYYCVTYLGERGGS